MKRVCLVNGSLRGKQAASLAFLKDLDRRLPENEFEKKIVSLKARFSGTYPESILKSMAECDALILVFPLYNYGIPGGLMRLLEDFAGYFRSAPGGDACRNRDTAPRVYAIVNCAYPKPQVTGECIRVLKNFSRRLSLCWRFAICVGTGPVVATTKRVPFFDLALKRGLAEMVADVRSGARSPHADCLVRPLLPGPVIAAVKRYYEKQMDMK